MYDTQTLILIAVAFLLAGTVKGVVGMGLPTVILAMTTAVIGLKAAIVLILLPTLLTNIWQALNGGQARAVIRVIWPFLLFMALFTQLGGMVMARADVQWLTILLGLILMLYGIVSLGGLHPRMPEGWNRWMGPLAGLCSGILAGMTGAGAFPGLLYLQSLGLPRNMLIQAMGMKFATIALALTASMGGQNLLSIELGAVSLASLLPAIIGMAIGARLRRGLSEALFRRLFFLGLVAMGATIALRAIV